MKHFSKLTLFVFVILFLKSNCLPIENDEIKINVDYSKIKNEEITTSSSLFNSLEDLPEEDGLVSLKEYSTSEGSLSKQSSSSYLPNVQSLIDQTNTISSNLEIMINDMTNNKRPTTATMLRLMLQNVRRLNSSLISLNDRVKNMPVIGNSKPNQSSNSISASASPSSAISNATINAANNINSVVNQVRNQLNKVSSDINNLLSRMRTSVQGSNKPANNKPVTNASG